MKNKRKKFYKKIKLNYNILSIAIVVILNIFILKNIKQRNIEYNKQINAKMVEETYYVYNNTKKNINGFVERIYKAPNIVADIMALLSNDFNVYVRRKLDIFVESNLSYYNGVEREIENFLKGRDVIRSIDIVSYKTKTIHRLFKNSRRESINFYGEDKDINTIKNENGELIYENELRVSKKIYNSSNLELDGMFVFHIDRSFLKEILKGYGENQYILMLQDGVLLHDTDSNKNYKVDVEKIKNIYTKKNNINMMELNNDIIVLGIFDSKKWILQDENLLILIFLANCVVLFIIRFVILKKFNRLNDRLNVVINTMENVNIDDKLKRIPKDVILEKDELSIICKYFNQMCDNLEQYIEKYYISQINEKNAEMKFLQSHINPHFLYNVLESIRMKAVINKDKDVARMIYLLAHLFRSQLKEKDVITIRNELEYCSKFLEIYKFRYTKAINYSVVCDEKLLDLEIIKFILQPLIENYFVHGIRLENDDNMLNINIKNILNIIVIVIKDNGKGIEKNKLKKLNEKLKNKENGYDKIGILNVNQRIKIKYGNEYGLVIESEENKGTKIIIKLPHIGGNSNV